MFSKAVFSSLCWFCCEKSAGDFLFLFYEVNCYCSFSYFNFMLVTPVEMDVPKIIWVRFLMLSGPDVLISGFNLITLFMKPVFSVVRFQKLCVICQTLSGILYLFIFFTCLSQTFSNI